MTIDQVHKVIRYYIKKSIEGYITPDEIDLVLDRAQMALFNDYYSNVKQFQPMAEHAAVGYGATQRINDALAPFKGKYTFLESDTASGIVNLPSGYMYLISLHTTRYVSSLGRNVTYGVQVVNEEELADRLESQIVPVDLTGPIAILNAANKIQLFPDVPQSGYAYYFRRPLAPKFNYTQLGRVVTYTSSGSQDLEWGEQDINNVISKALSYYGISMQSQDIIQYGEIKDKEGA